MGVSTIKTINNEGFNAPKANIMIASSEHIKLVLNAASIVAEPLNLSAKKNVNQIATNIPVPII